MTKAIVFDLDGTLVHTAPDVLSSLNHTLLSFGLSSVPESAIYDLMGHGVKYTLEKAFLEQNKKLESHEYTKALETYLSFYRENPVVKTTIYPGVIPTLTYLKKAGFQLGICTNKPSHLARIVTKKLNLDSYFSAFLCGEEVPHPKPHKQHINDVLTLLKGTPELSVMVGDSHVDETSAKNSGIAFVGVSYGYGLATFKPEVLIHDFSDLIPILNQKALL